MSVLLVGISHRSAPVSVLERVAVTDSDRPKLTDRMLASRHISEVMIVSTCNRVEVYAVVDAFHGALAVVGELLATHANLPLADLTKHAYVRYSEAAAEHLFAVASGLDSMVVGEQQVLGQIRAAYAASDAQQAAGRVLHELAQQSLRVGKRVHSETGIDSAGASVVSVALDRADVILVGETGTGLAGRTAVVVGAAAMGGLSVAHLTRAGIGRIVDRQPDAGEGAAPRRHRRRQRHRRARDGHGHAGRDDGRRGRAGHLYRRGGHRRHPRRRAPRAGPAQRRIAADRVRSRAALRRRPGRLRPARRQRHRHGDPAAGPRGRRRAPPTPRRRAGSSPPNSPRT